MIFDFFFLFRQRLTKYKREFIGFLHQVSPDSRFSPFHWHNLVKNSLSIGG